MTTQYERDSIRRANEARRLLALIDAATSALPAIEDPDSQRDLAVALKAYPDLDTMRRSVAYYDKEDARRQRDEDRIVEGKRRYEELPDAPPRRQCEAHVARDQGRWTDFGRCEKVATRIVMDYDAKRERCLCTTHAKEYVTDGKAGTGFNTLGKPGVEPKTHESWYRIHRWCMAPDPNPDARKPQRFCSVRADIATGRHDGKEHRFA